MSKGKKSRNSRTHDFENSQMSDYSIHPEDFYLQGSISSEDSKSEERLEFSPYEKEFEESNELKEDMNFSKERERYLARKIRGETLSI